MLRLNKAMLISFFLEEVILSTMHVIHWDFGKLTRNGSALEGEIGTRRRRSRSLYLPLLGTWLVGEEQISRVVESSVDPVAVDGEDGRLRLVSDLKGPGLPPRKEGTRWDLL